MPRILSYGVERRWSLRSRMAKRVGLAVLAAGLVVALAAVGWRLFRIARFVREQSLALTLSVPPEQIVCEQDPEKARALLASNSEYHPVELQDGTSLPADRMAAYWLPPSIPPAEWPPFMALLFSHSRCNPQGDELGVSVLAIVKRSPTAPQPSLVIQGRLWRPRGVLQTAIKGAVLSGWAGELRDPLPPGPLRFFAGQPDPKDCSRFTIPYEGPTESGVIEGEVVAGGRIRLHLRRSEGARGTGGH